MTTRRGFLRGLAIGLIAAPAIIKTPGLLMPIRPLPWEALALSMKETKEIVCANVLNLRPQTLIVHPHNYEAACRLLGFDSKLVGPLEWGEPIQYA